MERRPRPAGLNESKVSCGSEEKSAYCPLGPATKARVATLYPRLDAVCALALPAAFQENSRTARSAQSRLGRTTCRRRTAASCPSRRISAPRRDAIPCKEHQSAEHPYYERVDEANEHEG